MTRRRGARQDGRARGERPARKAVRTAMQGP